MITYANTVLVSNYASANTLATSLNPGTVYDGQFVIMDDKGQIFNSTSVSTAGEKFKVGMFTGKTQYNQDGTAKPEIRWSNWINKTDVTSIAVLSKANFTNSEDKVVIDFTGINSSVLAKFAEGGKRIIVRLTFKDLPTRFRKWTESYEYVTPIFDLNAVSSDSSDDAPALAYEKKIASDIAALINKQWKRARVIASASNGVLTLTAMQYDDDNSVNSINRFDKVRFNANIYFTDPAADGWESINKHFPAGVTVDKTPGKQYPASGKLVRDRENEAFGYMGILNRGEGTWPIVQPEMRTDISKNYNAITLQFENQYHTADDLFRRTKQSLEIYTDSANSNIVNVLKALTANSANNEGQLVDEVTEGSSSN